uniref:Si:dkeyp-86h10.3 n=1 Tax=Paramormyrops kingsleyae TaxID=1676925 RepID=A0A3B3S7S3_9TELE
MAERSPWWKSFTVRKKVTSRDSEVAHKESGPETQAGPEKTPAGGSKPSAESKENKDSSLISNETYDDSQFEPMFNEKTCRRTWKVSRSGRFKEKRRIRATLPENNNFYEGNSA